VASHTLKEGVLLHNEIQFKDGDAKKIEKEIKNPAINLALHTVKTGGQALIFAATRKSAVAWRRKPLRKISEALSKPIKGRLER
jgi:helicase